MMNAVSVIGRWTKEPELRYTPNGKANATGTLAVQRSFKNAQGEYEADFIQVVIWGKMAETVVNRTKKGSRFGGTGRIQTRNYENQEGRKIYITEVVIENVTMIDWEDGQTGQGNSQQSYGQGGQNPSYGQTYGQMNGQTNQGNVNVTENDLPF